MKQGDYMNFNIEFTKKLSLAYEAVCKPLCQQLKLPQTAFDILMFLSNNPQYKTARDIVEIRKLKANLVSINVDKLVKEGYLIRKEVVGDRRKTELCCTSKAQSVVKTGRKLQREFKDMLFDEIDEPTQEMISHAMGQMEENLDRILEEKK